LRDLAAGWTDPAWTDNKPPKHVDHEPYADEDEEYLYRSEAHGHIMHRPGLWRKPLVGEMDAPEVLSCNPVEGEHDRSPHWLGTLGGPIVLSFDGNRWNRSVGLEPEHIPYSLAGRSSPFG
jgi:hypothetical protein